MYLRGPIAPAVISSNYPHMALLSTSDEAHSGSIGLLLGGEIHWLREYMDQRFSNLDIHPLTQTSCENDNCDQVDLGQAEVMHF